MGATVLMNWAACDAESERRAASGRNGRTTQGAEGAAIGHTERLSLQWGKLGSFRSECFRYDTAAGPRTRARSVEVIIY